MPLPRVGRGKRNGLGFPLVNAMKKLLERLIERLLAKPLEKFARKVIELNNAAGASREGEEDKQESGSSSAGIPASSVPWDRCRYSSNWDNGAAKRLMNILSPKFDDKKFGDYLAWIIGKGCDHCHAIFVNGADGEGAGYDALTNSATQELALKRVKLIRSKGLGVVGWIVTDDSDSDRKKIFSNPAKYAEGLKPFMPYLSYIVLGLEMDEKLDGEQIPTSKWKALRDAVKNAGWSGKFGTHHTGGKSTYASLGEIVCDQLDPSCTTSQIKSSVKALLSRGYAVCGFEYSRNPDKSKSQAALDAGAFSVGNWAGGNKPITTAASQEKEAAGTGAGEAAATTAHDDAVNFDILNWDYGGFNGSKASLSSKARIKNLKVSSSGMSYSWEAGGCEDLGAASRDHADCLACLFVLVGGAWRGGKFDWISTSRQTRDFKNIEGSYNGWPKNSIGNADAYAFVIVGRDAKTRTNVIIFSK